MLRPLLALLVVGLVGYGIYQFFQAPAPATEVAALATPEAQFHQLLSSSPVSAEQMSRVCNRYPQLALKLLRNRPIKISGNVESIFVTGLDGRRALITLSKNDRLKLVVSLDMNQYAVLGLDPLGDRRVHYLLVGNELLKVTPIGVYHYGTRRVDVNEEIRTTVFTCSMPFEGMVTLDRISPNEIILKGTAK